MPLSGTTLSSLYLAWKAVVDPFSFSVWNVCACARVCDLVLKTQQVKGLRPKPTLLLWVTSLSCCFSNFMILLKPTSLPGVSPLFTTCCVTIGLLPLLNKAHSQHKPPLFKWRQSVTSEWRCAEPRRLSESSVVLMSDACCWQHTRA